MFLVGLFSLFFFNAHAAPVADLNLSATASPLYGDNVTITLTFDNTDATDTGYYPIMRFVLPPELAYSSVDDCGGLGTPTITQDNSDPGTDPYTGEEITLAAGETLIVVKPLVGQITPDQPNVVCQVTATAASQTVFETDQITGGRAIFVLGGDPGGVADVCGGAGDTICSTVQTADVTPTLFTLSKSLSQPRPSGTGPEFPVDFTVAGSLASGQTLNNVSISDVIPDEIVLTPADPGDCSTFTMSPAPTTCVYTPDATATSGGTIALTYATLNANTSLEYTGYIPETDDASAAVINATTGATTTSQNLASADADEFPSAQTDQVTINHRSVDLTKSVANTNDLGGSGNTPGDTLTYTLRFSVSDYFQIQNITIDDTIGDGQFYVNDSLNVAVRENGSTTNVNEPNATAQGHYSHTYNAGDGTTDLALDLGGILGDAFFGFADSVLSGDDTHGSGSSTLVTITYETTILDDYVSDPGSGDTSVDASDDLVNNVNSLEFDIVGGDVDVTRTASATATIAAITSVTKEISHLNGGAPGAAPVHISAGDTVTYKITTVIPGGDAEDMKITDFLPRPLFTSAPCPSYNASNPPAVGNWTFGTNDSGVASGSIAVSCSTTNNSIEFAFPDFDVAGGSSGTVEIYFTVTAQNEPIQDGLLQVNLAQLTYNDSTNTAAATAVATQSFVGDAPELSVSKNATLVSGNSSISDGDVSEAEGSEEITFEVDIENTGAETAFDVELTDTLPAGFGPPSGGACSGAACSYAISLSADCNNGGASTPDTTTDVDQDEIKITDMQIAAGDTCTVTYTLKLDSTVVWGSEITNTATVRFASELGGSDFSPATDSSNVTIDEPSATIAVSQPSGEVGDSITYSITVDLPQGQSSSFSVTAQERTADFWGTLDVSDFSVAMTGGLSGAGPFCSTSDTDLCFTNDPTATGSQSVNTTFFLMNLGATSNVNTDFGAHTFTLEITAQVLQEVTGNHNTRARIISEAGTAYSSNVGFNVLAPSLTITKCADAATSAAAPLSLADSAGFRVMIENNGTSPAYDVTDVVDKLYRGLVYSSNTVTAYYCSDGASAVSCGGWVSGDCAAQGGTLSTVSATVRAGESVEAANFGVDGRQDLTFPVIDGSGNPDIEVDGYFVLEFTNDISCESAADGNDENNYGVHTDDDGFVDGCTLPRLPEGNTLSNSVSVTSYTSQDGVFAGEGDYGPTNSNTLTVTLDHDGDGIPNSSEGDDGDDADGDGVPNYLDTDSDDNGIDDATEGTGDADGDGIPDYRDIDDDNDGITDADEIVAGGDSDTDGDGSNDYEDPDSDGDGIGDGDEGGIGTDTDGDGTDDYLDLDSDNDGIPDLIEQGLGAYETTGDGLLSPAEITASGLDVDGDGAINEDELAGGFFDDADGDGDPNFRELDSDNDGLPDLDEAGLSVFDDNGDGYITTAEGADIDDGAGDDVSGGDDDDNSALDLDEIADADFDLTPDFLDHDSDQDGVADIIENGRYVCDANTNGEIDYPGEVTGCTGDPDGNGNSDGFIQIGELALLGNDVDSIPDYQDVDSDGDGIGDIIEASATDRDNNTDGEITGMETLISTFAGLEDTDSDTTTPDIWDTDSDGDTILDLHESDDANDDYDAGTIVVLWSGLFDSDTDPDGTPNPDGTPDFRETDSDDDGYLDEDEAGDANPNTVPVDLEPNGTPEFQQFNRPELVITKCVSSTTAGNEPITLADELEYIIQVKNTGDRGAYDVDNVVDNLMQGLKYTAGGVTAFACSAGASTDSCEHNWGADADCTDVSTDVRGVEVVEAPIGGDNRQEIEFPVFDGVAGDPDMGVDAYFVVKFTADVSCESAADGNGPDAYGVHTDNDGFTDGCTDPRMPYAATVDNVASVVGYEIFNGDGAPPYYTLGNSNTVSLDMDHDGDGIINDDEDGGTGILDSDGDGVPNYLDSDSDDNGISDDTDGTGDADGDGTEDYADTDDDNDGVNDADEIVSSGGGVDTDGDGANDEVDPDADGDGIIDGDEDGEGTDTDSDGLDDFLDTDSDNDGIPDFIENGLGAYDTDDDGLLSPAEITASGLDDNSDGAISESELDGSGGAFPNTDGVGSTYNFRDDDADDDGLPDLYDWLLEELTVAQINAIDTNGNGYIDTPGEEIALGNAVGDADGVIEASDMNDLDSDSIWNHLDTDSDQDGVPDILENGRYVCDVNGDGDIDYPAEVTGCTGDPDGNGNSDGFIQPSELTVPDRDTDATLDYLDRDADGDGIGDLIEAFSADVDGNTDGFISTLEYAIAIVGIGDADAALDFNELPDTDTNGTPDIWDTDSDGDTILDLHESDNREAYNAYNANTLVVLWAHLFDSEAAPDGTPDFRDTESDGDGVLDSVEAGDVATGTVPVDTDSDGDPDFQDLDSDGDELNDEDEITLGSNRIVTDSDGDGCFDGCEVFGNVNAFAACPYDDVANAGWYPGAGNVGAPITDPTDSDTDDGGTNDCDEASNPPGDYTNPMTGNGADDAWHAEDNDNDGLTNDEETFNTLTDPNDNDSDDDGCTDGCEVLGNTAGCVYDDAANSHWFPGVGTLANPVTNPLSTDTDTDTCNDCLEATTMNTNPRVTDTDGDDVNDCRERTLGTDPNDTDSDDDDLTDGEEVNDIGSDPLDTDTDDDGCLDADEVNTYESDPLSDPDTDGDGLTDCQEDGTYGTDPELEDTDDGGIDDGVEVNTFNTDPLDPLDDCPNTRDTDGDGLSDCEEVSLGSDPTDASEITIQGSGTDGLFGVGCGQTRKGAGLGLLFFLGLAGLSMVLRRRRVLLSLGVMLGIWMALSPAMALDVQLFRPAPDRGDGVTVRGSNVLDVNQWQASLFLNFVRNPIEFGFRTDDPRVDDIVNWFLTSNAMFEFGLHKRVTLGVDVPVNFLSNVEGLTQVDDDEDMSLGDVLIRATIQLRSKLNDGERQWGFALVPFITVPTGSEPDFMGQANVTGGVRLVADRWISPRNYLAFNIGFRGRERERIANLNVNHELLGSVSYVRKLSVEKKWDFFAEMFGSVATTDFFTEETSAPVEFVAGLRKYWKEREWVWVLGAGRGMNNGVGAPDYRVFTGLTYTPQKEKEPEPVPTPTPIPMGKLNVTVKDAQGDAVLASLLLQDAEKTQVFLEENASELERELTPSNYMLYVQAKGYQSKEEFVEMADAQHVIKEIVLLPKLGKKIELIGLVHFDLNKATIKEESYSILDNVVEVLNKYPDVKKVRVEAHTDSQGSEAYNLDLSKRRAKAVMVYLIDKGIDGDRLTSQGFGETRPVETNETKEGRAKNRRVEFTILDDGSQTSIENKKSEERPVSQD